MEIKLLTTITLIFTMVLLGAVASQEVFAQTQGMSITATAPEDSDIISVKGHTTKFLDVTFQIVSPSGYNIVDITQITPNPAGDFNVDFVIGPTWTEDGFYTIKAMQGTSQNTLYNLSVDVEIIDGMTTEIFETESSLEKNILDKIPTGIIESGLSISADAVEGSNIIGIKGTTDKTNVDVTLTVTAPNGNVVSVDQITPDMDGNFAADITTGGPLWKQDGFYKVTAHQDNSERHRGSVEVEIIDGLVIPEFGQIAVLILATAIVSIIAVTSRSRLSIMPRY